MQISVWLKSSRNHLKQWVNAGLAVILLIAYQSQVAAEIAEDLNPPIEQTLSQSTPILPPHPSVTALETLGRKMFFDANLSASGRLSCASCHDPRHAYGPANGLAVQLGGHDMRAQGPRAVPSLRYLQTVPLFTEHFHDEDVDDSVDAGPTGGFTWDGRAASLHEQARIPLLAAAEMANSNPAQVVAAIKRSVYVGEFSQVFGVDIFQDNEAAFKAACTALEVFQQNPEEFYPYTSKYDAFLRGETKLSRREAHGLDLFNDPQKGNCASCHPSALGRNRAFPNFTDFGYIAIGVPRNRQLQANADPDYFDLGLCGPFRQDLADQSRYCGLFRTPSLRNVATRQVFFHNGVFHNLLQVLHFYVGRDSHPEKYYAKDAEGRVMKYDDLPGRYHDHVNQDAPFGGDIKDRPVLTNREINDIIAFLHTLSDGWSSTH
ncbi:hypothetical protein KEF85_09810 [Methylomonas paludis]|uniref:Cytochrome c domain-containing protein n=1 Tax=Methylomonas paludis TaxID=1173101 RepID=A0A975MKX1_9GAMM|nr:cytochrome c peroxidase [Methylomonas paludis]QWF69672.1 hypothetical protein KEF85_09810 [Methylomonas paludis]